MPSLCITISYINIPTLFTNDPKFVNAYHGHADYLLVKGGLGLSSLNIPLSKGVPKDFIKHTISAGQNDTGSVERIFKRYGRSIAAVIIEPVGGNHGVIPPNREFLQYVRNITREFGALLIFDEVITGFRFRFGSAAVKFGVEPDLICLGKILGGGLPVGAFGAKDSIMDKLSLLGGIYQASTFAGNPVVMQAGISVLKILSSLCGKYKILEQKTDYLIKAVNKAAEENKVGLSMSSYGSMFSFSFSKKGKFSAFYKEMLKRGVYLAPSEYEANFVSFAHTKGDIDKTVKAVRAALAK